MNLKNEFWFALNGTTDTRIFHATKLNENIYQYVWYDESIDIPIHWRCTAKEMIDALQKQTWLEVVNPNQVVPEEDTELDVLLDEYGYYFGRDFNHSKEILVEIKQHIQNHYQKRIDRFSWF